MNLRFKMNLQLLEGLEKITMSGLTDVILDFPHPSLLSDRQLFPRALNATAEANSQWR